MTYRQRLHLQRLKHSTAPILIGPWIGEVGFETLYWLPFLTYLRQAYGLKKERLIAVTRGGAGYWYDAAHSIELYDYVPIKDLRLALADAFQKTKSMKQMTVTPFEDALIPLLAQRLALRRYHVLHPSLLYTLFQPWWNADMSLRTATHLLKFAPIPVPLPLPELELPEQYAVVKFYQRPTWPLQDDLRDWVQDVVTRISAKVPVVLLDTGLQGIDDHSDFPIPTGPRVLSLAGKVTPQNNLLVQSAVLAKAKAFIGTYGGTMQLAVRLGIPSAGFFKEFKDTAYPHKLLTEFLGTQFKTPVFIGRPADGQFVQEILG